MFLDDETVVEYELERQSYKDLPQYLCVCGIHKAVLEGDFGSLKRRIELGECVNERLSRYNFSVLHLAVIKNNVEILEYLLAREDVDVDARCSEGRTPLYLATALGRIEFVRKLIRAGADVNVSSYEDEPLLHMSVHYPDICHLLIRYGAPIDAVNSWGCTLLYEAVYCECLEVMHMLLYYNADPNIADVHDITPFMMALMHCKLDAQEALLEYVDDFDRASYDSMWFGSTLSFALRGNSPFIRDIMERGADVNYGDDPETREEICAFSACLQNPVDLSTFKMVWERLVYNDTKNTIDLLDFLYYDEVVPAFLQVIIESDNFEPALEFFSESGNYSLFVDKFAEEGFELEQLTVLTCRLLQYGFRATSHDVHAIFFHYGYCELFRMLLYMDNDFTRGWLPHMAYSRLLFDIDYDIESAVDEVDDIPEENVMQLLEYSICSRLTDALILRYGDDERMSKILTGLPRVPSLVELARNVARKHIRQTFKITNACQFYTILDRFDIPSFCKRVLMFERKIYRIEQKL
ncbi:uncharacterized protein LOC108909215 [Anoplophora glabripennis]|uniref:uncharacterized protein LOC108909215 n=1 Tax=Anoplophora glabripennis TaxID=217634 RepID=UPI000C778B54|nr:uncharacterized protein LOC108909215 [Anoplophora glabripennis]XP_023311286.1 uncharacterized protein LOC108909215 [Anoplophora glabripennis]